MSNDKGSNASIREQVRLIMGLLLGSGLAGAAIALVEKQPLAWAFVSFLVLMSVGLFLWSEWFIERKRRRALADLNRHYVSSLQTTGDILATKLDSLGQLELEREQSIRKQVMTLLVNDFKQQSEGLAGNQEPGEALEMFESGIKKIVEYWHNLSQSGADTGGPADE